MAAGWQDELKHNLVSAEDLITPLHLTELEYRQIKREVERFPMSISRYYMSLIDPDDPDDPIRKLAVPSGITGSDDGILDTSGEHSNTVIPGVQHKYRQTVLVLVTSECAMYCRHCFRRRLVGLGKEETCSCPEKAAAYIEAHPEVTNVLLSGGDALMLETENLKRWLDVMSSLPQLDLIRIGTRIPVTFPERITGDPSLLRLLDETGRKKQIYVVTHFNHPRELTWKSVSAVKLLQRAGVVVKNQTVLLKGVNDDPEVLGMLLRRISSIGVIQHYIFQCRPVMGVKSRFQVPMKTGLRIVSEANAMQNGPGKSADYTMSHVTGKIRLLGEADGKLIMQYRQAKDPSRIGKMFLKEIDAKAAWFDEDPLDKI